MIPIFSSSGVITPGQFGPSSRVFLFARRIRSRTTIMSRTGMPSVMQMTRSRSASTASQIASAAPAGGTYTTEKVTEAFKIMLHNPNVKGILVNIFGGIMRCDTIATGIVAAAKETHLSVPLVVRMKGTNEDLGKQILADSGLPIIAANDMADAAQKIVAAVAGK